MTVAILFPRCCLPEKVSTFRDISDWLPKLSLKEQRKISNEIKTKAPCRAIYLSSVSFFCQRSLVFNEVIPNYAKSYKNLRN